MTDGPVTEPATSEPATSESDESLEATATSESDEAPAATATSERPETSGTSDTTHEADAPDTSRLEQEGDIAADYLEGLLDIADLDGDIDMDVERDRASVSVVGGGLDHLVGDSGKVLEALQDLTRLAVLRETGQRSRLMLDVGGFRKQRRAEIAEVGRQAAEKAKSSGEPVRLEPMSPFERKVVHDAVAAAGLRSESEGEEPERRVVVVPG